MSDQLTPRPWTFTPSPPTFYRRILAPMANSNGTWHVAIVNLSDADAYLMAAAPDLLAACEAKLALRECQEGQCGRCGDSAATDLRKLELIYLTDPDLTEQHAAMDAWYGEAICEKCVEALMQAAIKKAKGEL